MEQKKNWVVFFTVWGNFVSKKKMTYDEAEKIWHSAQIHKDYFDVFGLKVWENLIVGICTSECWTRQQAEEFAEAEQLKNYERNYQRIESLMKEKGE